MNETIELIVTGIQIGSAIAIGVCMYVLLSTWQADRKLNARTRSQINVIHDYVLELEYDAIVGEEWNAGDDDSDDLTKIADFLVEQYGYTMPEGDDK